ncbi:tigger transposable element-derived protein 4-like [Anthonomus grandis grandis]|uniref:tigger transposable element-derived protein 4-like n=1 Tax=Anthonomus grandis grandis TaxID=2921223 RepID=UPI002165A9E5|nr:tigger transposable element-derived protein 4-like [Anthonomus grandis grandis]
MGKDTVQRPYYRSVNHHQSHKKIRNPVRLDVDQALIRWFEVRRTENIPISGPLLKAKAEDLSKRLHGGDFKCSTGWRFKVRRNINVGKVSGEAGDVSREAVVNWLTEKWPSIAQNYSCEDIFNGDETGLFYKMTPDRTLKFRVEKCVGGKQSKLRYTVWVCANMTGSEKCKLLVIGKYERPRCMKNIKNLPVIYKSNRRAWMTSDIFINYLKEWDEKLRRQKRKILLLVDNCAAHPKNVDLTNIRLEFLPPNCTSVIQPMDQGIIKCLKTYYCRYFMYRLIQALDSEETFNLTILDSIKIIAKSWNEVSQKTIQNCFRHAGLVKSIEEFDSDDDLPLNQWYEKYKSVDDDDEWDIPLSYWLQNHC